MTFTKPGELFRNTPATVPAAALLLLLGAFWAPICARAHGPVLSTGHLAQLCTCPALR